MSDRARDVTRAGRVMLNAEVDPLFFRVLTILAARGTQTSYAWEEVVEACRSSGSWSSVAQVLTGATAQAPDSAVGLVNALGLSFEPIGVAGSESSPSTPEFIMGTLLGLFQAVIWLDDHCGMLTDFERCLPARLPEMILSSERMMVKADFAINKEYEQELSQAIKKWARPEDPHRCIGGRRLAQYQELVQNLTDKLWKIGSAAASGTPQPKFRDLVLDQLAYAQFGAISPMGRIIAMSAFFASHKRFLRETTPHASPARQA